MTRAVAVFLFFVLTVNAPAAPPNRILVISSPSRADTSFQQQAAELVAEWTGLIERDFVVRTQFGSAEFSVVLIGKDGGEKLRRKAPLTTRELFAIVDAMPMRRAEMEKNRGQ
jgi:hypothetical protein